MPASPLARAASKVGALLTAVALLLAAGAPAVAQAQTATGAKALVYCPSVDVTGCNQIVTTLTGTAAFPGGVDRAYDGTSGTVDLAYVTLSQYAVLVIPSLADVADVAPYTVLRSAAVQAHLKAGVNGRVAVWAGSPDVGADNRAAKDQLLKNLASWGATDWPVAGTTGLVVLADLSADAARRYDWLGGVSRLGLTADPELYGFDAATPLTGTGKEILRSSSSSTTPLAYANMASFGLYVAEGSVGVVGATGTATDSTGATITSNLLVTAAGAGNTGAATIGTDKADYLPGMTVTFTGSGWTPGETVSINLHENPLEHADRTLTSVADSSGNITNTDLVLEDHNLGVTFYVTAKGGTSALIAQTSFTDGDAPDGGGTMVVSSTSVATGSTNTLVFTFTTKNGEDFANGSQLTLQIPSGWTKPTSSNIAVTAPQPKGCSQATIPTGGIANTGSGPWTITVNMTCAGTGNNSPEGFKLTYSGAIAPSVAANTNYTFTTQTKSFVSSKVPGTLTILANGSPVVSVTAPTNTPPVATPQSISALEDAATAVTLSGTDIDGNGLTYAVVTNPAHGTLSGTAPALTYTPASNYNGSDSFTFTANDGTVSSSPATVSITVAAVNDAPSFTKGANQTVNEDAAAQSVANWATSISAGPSDENGQTINLIVSNDNNALFSAQPEVAANGTLAYTPAANAHGSATVTVAAHDNGGTANGGVDTSAPQTFTITVNPVADATTTALASSLNPSTYGDAVTFTATVSSGAPEPIDGSVQFKDGAANLGSPVSVAGGTAALTTSALTVATHSVTAVYVPGASGNFTGSTSPAVSQVVGKGTATVTLSGLTPTYDGNPKSAAATTTPAGLNVSTTYNGSTTAPTDAGSYSVVATVADANYEGSTTGTLVIGKATATLAFAAGTLAQTYDGSAHAVTVNTTPSGLSAVSVTYDGGATAPTNAGSYAIVASLVNQNYEATALTGTLVVAKASQATLVLTGAPTTPAVFGTTYALGSTGGSGGGAVTFSAAGSTACSVSGNTLSIDHGTGTCSVTASKADDANYLAATSAPVTVTVAKATQTISFDALDAKTYGGAPFSVDATASSSLPVAFSASGKCTIAAPAMGSSEWLVSLTGAGNCTVTATQAGNGDYEAAAPVPQPFTIAPKSVSIGSVTVDNKTYDGNTSASISARALANGSAVGGDDVSLSGGTAAFVDKNAGTGKTVNVTGLVLAGADAGNYTLGASSTTTTANIDRRSLTVAATGQNKTYDGTTAATVTLSDNRVSGDVLTVAYASAAFADKNAGTGKVVTVAEISISGADAGNYTANASATTTADILKKSASVTPNAASKVYNTADPSPLTTGTLSGFLSGDNVTATYSRTPGETVLGGPYTISATLAPTAVLGNYEITNNTASFTITPAPVTIAAFNDLVKPYTGTQQKPTVTTAPSGVSLKLDFYQDNQLVGGTAGVTNVGVYRAVATTNDPNYVVSTGEALFVIFDAAGGYVTGGGWINSPVGASVQFPQAVGRANFGFVSKYQKGATTPTGSTEFQFQAGNLNFKSTVYEWLTVSGARAQYKGSGTINGSGNYGFILTGIDGEVAGGNGTDRFRIKITDSAGNVVYDNQITTTDDAGLTSQGTLLGGGSIVIHK